MDTFGIEPRELSEKERLAIQTIKSAAGALAGDIERLCQPSAGSDAMRCRAIARTKLQECVMWAVKGITG